MKIKVKRVYEPASRGDGFRVLVDRVWPRGLTKEEAGLDFWARDLAPSTELRKWFNHDVSKFAQFRTRYRRELSRNKAAALDLSERAGKKTITLLFGARDPAHNQAVVLQEFLSEL